MANLRDQNISRELDEIVQSLIGRPSYSYAVGQLGILGLYPYARPPANVLSGYGTHV